MFAHPLVPVMFFVPPLEASTSKTKALNRPKPVATLENPLRPGIETFEPFPKPPVTISEPDRSAAEPLTW